MCRAAAHASDGGEKAKSNDVLLAPRRRQGARGREYGHGGEIQHGAQRPGDAAHVEILALPSIHRRPSCATATMTVR
jgi:hypothetical protein